jgi:hypothetical protein
LRFRQFLRPGACPAFFASLLGYLDAGIEDKEALDIYIELVTRRYRNFWHTTGKEPAV